VGRAVWRPYGLLFFARLVSTISYYLHYAQKESVYPATIVGIPPQEDAWLGKATERIFLAPIKMTMVPEIIDMDMPIEGVFHNLVIAKIKKRVCRARAKSNECHVGAGQMMSTRFW